ncbi:hypothetical protein B0H12DRAFT_1101557 [Mycena haematopus]|nr:hypothetical protein B0H12DRAFT_1101557 [Mycena haematopus]
MSSASIGTRAPRQAATRASAKFEGQLMSSPVKEQSTAKPVKRASRPTVKKEQSKRSKRSMGLPKSAPPRPSLRKSQISPVSRSDNESELTSLSTPTPSPVLRSRPALSIPQSNVDLDAESSYVWVLVNFDGDVFRLEDEEDGEERIWWPAQIVPSVKPDLRVRLFGTLRTSSKAVVAVETPHAENLKPIVDTSDEIRFTKPEYVVSSKHTPSPAKRRKLDKADLKADLEAKWIAAVSQAVHDYQHDVMPSLEFLRSVRAIPSHALPARTVSEDALSELSDAPRSERWSPPPPDTSLEIPGEKILARESKSSKFYWPAKILDYIQPSRPSESALYEIQWVDNKTAKIPRDFFYSLEEDGFGTCRLGPVHSTVQEVVNDTDEPATPQRRGPSPEPLDPPPSEKEFCDLSVHEQFVYTKPVLQAILCDRYPPARVAHNLFISGRLSAQHQLLLAASLSRGLIDPRDVEDFQRCLLEWCLRDTARGVRVAEEPEQPEDVGFGEATVETQNFAVAGEVDEAEKPKSTEACSEDPAAPLTAVDSTDGNADPAMQERLCNPPSPTPTTNHDGASSPVLPPPSSSFNSIITDVPMEVEEVDAPDEGSLSLDGAAPAPDVDTTAAGDAFDTASVLSEASDVSSLIAAPKPPPQVGCPEYEQLQPLRKMDYCLNVLLPELLIQISVWRAGKRTSVELLSEQEEAELHEFGEQERSKTDWVFDVNRMRERKETELRKREIVVGGTTSRPKKVLRSV